MEFSTLLPAYGRDYKSRRAVLDDWMLGKDFRCAVSGRYCSSRDFTHDINIRYKAKTRVAVLKYDMEGETWR